MSWREDERVSASTSAALLENNKRGKNRIETVSKQKRLQMISDTISGTDPALAAQTEADPNLDSYKYTILGVLCCTAEATLMLLEV